MEEKLNFTGLDVSLTKKLTNYLTELIGLLSDDGLESIIVYGSAAIAEFDAKHSNVNLMVVVRALDLPLLRKVQPLVRKGHRKGIVAPLFLTHRHMETSSDVFPIEFLDMSDFHHLIYGQNPFTKLEINTEHLCLECEEKLKGSLITLRQSFLELAHNSRDMMNLIASSITTLSSVFRGLIRLAGKKAPASKPDVITAMAKLYPVDADNFLKALDIKAKKLRMKKDEVDSFFAAYLADIEKLALHVDKMGAKISQPTATKTASTKSPMKKPASLKTKTIKKKARRRSKSISK